MKIAKTKYKRIYLRLKFPGNDWCFESNDIRFMHGLDAELELAYILSNDICKESK